jgi:hypothetical protein
VLRRFADRGLRNGDDGDRLAGGREDLQLVALGNVGAKGKKKERTGTV